MSFWLLIKIFFLVFYVGICAIITYIVYKEQNQYYTPLYVTKKPSKEGEKEIKINLHDEFEEYNKRDQPINLFRLFIGVLFFGAIKLFLNIICALIITYKATKRVKDKKINQEDIDFIRNTTEFFTKIFLKISGVFVNKKRLPDEKVLKIYQKYFGPNYKIDYDGKFSCYISNHSCIYDLIFGMAFYGCGFVAKQEIRDIPIFGKMASSLHTIFVNRNSTGSKNNTLDEIVERQKNFYEGKPVMPFMIYPEGTTTSGRHLLRFKKGAFSSLLPIKATILKPNLSDKYHLSCGSSDVGMNFVRSLAKLYVNAEYIELPIITPNEYMYEHFGNFGKEKWEIFAEVTREIMCELGDFKKSQRGIRDNFRYCSCIEKKTLLDSKTYKIE
jgi:lysophosphatidylcholine acyltransferase/lyso-PAF acetyltransferase